CIVAILLVSSCEKKEEPKGWLTCTVGLVYDCKEGKYLEAYFHFFEGPQPMQGATVNAVSGATKFTWSGKYCGSDPWQPHASCPGGWDTVYVQFDGVVGSGADTCNGEILYTDIRNFNARVTWEGKTLTGSYRKE
ncbi:MAG: hypothetical protein NT028_01710, partial [candidate division Zixibacteria bacterium]|nr:hypothetical protein [candidate division Zixibacteria bacterium]